MDHTSFYIKFHSAMIYHKEEKVQDGHEVSQVRAFSSTTIGEKKCILLTKTLNITWLKIAHIVNI